MNDRKHPVVGLLLSLSLGLALGQPAQAQSEPGQEPEAATETPKGLESCDGTTLEMARCYVLYRESLVETEGGLLERLYQALAQSGPEGTDYGAAAASLRTAEEHWRVYMRADCDIVDSVFGEGTALGLAGEDCVIRHYEARNEELRDLEHDYLQTEP